MDRRALVTTTGAAAVGQRQRGQQQISGSPSRAEISLERGRTDSLAGSNGQSHQRAVATFGWSATRCREKSNTASRFGAPLTNKRD
jgi:hypothetical protein